MSPMAQDLPTCRERLAQVEEENARLKVALSEIRDDAMLIGWAPGALDRVMNRIAALIGPPTDGTR